MTNNSTVSSQRNQQKSVAEDEIDLSELFQNVLEGKWFIVFFTFMISMLTFIYAYGQVPIYQANTLLRVEEQKASVPGLDNFSSLLGGGIKLLCLQRLS